MSQNQTSDQNASNTPATQHIEESQLGPYLLEWNYSGKALRAMNLLFWIITLLVIGLVGYLTLVGKQLEGRAFTVAWIVAIVLLLALWTYFLILYFYRTKTFKYRLTTHSLDTHQGFFTRRWDTMELINVEDIAVHVHLYDKILNGGVGTVTIYSKTDKTHADGVQLAGIENPQEVFDTIKKTRDDIRAKRALIS